ncbi:MAG: hypothetical protein ABGF52_00145 [Candidatus Asgardarchaeum sp.]
MVFTAPYGAMVYVIDGEYEIKIVEEMYNLSEGNLIITLAKHFSLC